MRKNIFLIMAIVPLITCAQKKQTYNLQQMLKEKKLTSFAKTLTPVDDNDKHGVSCTGLAWLNDVHFSKGTIEVDLRGKDVVQQSFLGIAFHGVDTTTYDIIYFRPFNFRSSDPVRRIHAVQYVSEPKYPWDVLREKFNGVYEKGIDPPPLATAWFHARIVVEDNEIKVYVNGADNPSLTVKKLNTRTDGLVGVWNEGLPGDFANLVITE